MAREQITLQSASEAAKTHQHEEQEDHDGARELKNSARSAANTIRTRRSSNWIGERIGAVVLTADQRLQNREWGFESAPPRHRLRRFGAIGATGLSVKRPSGLARASGGFRRDRREKRGSWSRGLGIIGALSGKIWLPKGDSGRKRISYGRRDLRDASRWPVAGERQESTWETAASK